MPNTVNDNSEQRQWYAIRTKARQETVARLNYLRQGYQVYLPQLRKTVRHARQTTEKLAPFFPGYLFLYVAPAKCDWTAISSTRGSMGALCFGDTYVPVPDWVIEDLKAREDKNNSIPAAGLIRKKLIPGSIVTVKIGGEEGVQGVVYSSRGTENVEVLLNLLSRQVKTTVPLSRIDL